MEKEQRTESEIWLGIMGEGMEKGTDLYNRPSEFAIAKSAATIMETTQSVYAKSFGWLSRL